MRPAVKYPVLPALFFFSYVAANAAIQNNPSSEAATKQIPAVVPLFIEDGDYTSTLILVNGSTVSTYADVTVRALDGSTVTTKRVQFQPDSQQPINIRALLDSAGKSGVTAGSITVLQSSSLSGVVITAVLTMTRLTTSSPNYIDQEISMPSAAGSQTLRAVADRGDGSPIVAITSLSNTQQHIQLQCLTKGGVQLTKSTALSPGETLLTEACSEPILHGVDFQTFAQNPSHDTHGPIGIALNTDGAPGSFAAFALAPHGQEDNRYFSSVAFSDPKTILSPTTVFTGVPVGVATPLTSSNYTPTISLANFATTDAHVTIRYSQTSQDTPSVQDLETVTVPALKSKEVSVAGLKGDPNMQNSFLVVSDGAPGDVGAKLVAKSDSQLHEVELLGKDLNNPQNGGNHPWSLENGTNSTLLLFNTSSKPQYFNVAISAGTTVWRKAYQLQPMQTKAISIVDLIKQNVKDDKGKLLPKDIWSGQIGWHVPAKNAGRGRILQSNPETAMARNFSCGFIAELCEADFDTFGETGAFGFGITIGFGQMSCQVCANSCSGSPVGPGGSGYSYSWSSEDPSIASISGSGTDSSVDLFGVNLGTTFIDGSVSDGFCSQNMPSQFVAVPPTFSSISPAKGLVGTAINVTISGTGFAAGATINAGSSISVSNVNVVSSTQITATFTPLNSTSAGGNQGVTVTVTGLTSNSQNFFVQYPLHLGYIDEPSTPTNGHSAITSGTSITITDVSGTVQATGVCGGYQWVTYGLADQSGNRITNGTVTFSESFSNLSPSPSPFGNPPVGNPSSPNLATSVLGDTYAIWNISPPACPPTSASDSFMQQWTATVGTAPNAVTYSLTTVISISRSTNSGGLPSFTSSITTP